jgi:hypothetical protein
LEESDKYKIVMDNNFKKYLNLISALEEKGSILIPENFDWAKTISSMLPNINLDLPQIQKKSKIDFIIDKKNPIYIQLADGSKLFFTHDEFKRIEGKPERGKTLIVHMQRLNNDISSSPSKIIKCQVV